MLHYIKKAIKIIDNEGFAKFINRVKQFIHNQILSWPPIPDFYLYKINTSKNKLTNEIRYDAPPNPYKNIWVASSKIEYKQSVTDSSLSGITNGLGQIKAGDWPNKQNVTNVKNISTADIKERFEEGKQWENTRFYSKRIDYYEKNHRYKKYGFNSAQQYVKKRCHNLDELYENIKVNGYQEGHSGPTHRGTSDLSSNLEVLVTIGRDGQIYLWDGRHRLIISQILGLKIPVQVLCRHKEWQILRDEIYNNGVPDDINKNKFNHPDLQDVIFENSSVQIS